MSYKRLRTNGLETDDKPKWRVFINFGSGLQFILDSNNLIRRWLQYTTMKLIIDDYLIKKD